MDKVIDIKLEELDKDIKSVLIYFQNGDKKIKEKYSIYNPNFLNILEDVRNILKEESSKLNSENGLYKFWVGLSKAGLAFLIIYVIFLLFTFSRPSLLSILPLLLGMTPSIIAMSVENKKNVNREQHVLEMLKKVDKVDNFIKVKGINKVRVARNYITRTIQNSKDKTISAVRSFANDVIIATHEELHEHQQIKPSSEKLKELRRQITEQIYEEDRQRRETIDKSLDRLESMVDNPYESNRRRGRR